MPEIKLTQVMAFSSEDHNFPAKNLLSSENFKKWKSKSAGEKDVSVMLQFECSTQVEAVHVGNEGSAFVEIFVGKLGADVKDFEVLLPTSSFMSPAESRSGTNPSRVRLFGRDKLSAAALGRPWDCARVVCTQPFCRTAAYGLAFVKFLAPAAPAAAAAQPAAAVAQPAAGDVVRLGSFTLRPESSDEIRAGGLFSRRSQLTAAGGSLTREDRADRVVPPRQPPSATQTSTDEPPLPTGHYQLKPETKQKRPTESKPARPETQPAARRDTAGPASSGARRTVPAPGATRRTEPAPGAARRTEPASGAARRTEPAPGATRRTEPAPSRAPAGSAGAGGTAVSNGDTSGARPPATATYRPLDKLLSGVVFAMSGYKNPERATLREQGIRLGAKYRPDWTPDCTHLICAFRNTPKHVQVRGRGKIVLGSWLMACATQKRRLSWRRHALEPADGRAPDSEDEVWAEELRPRPAAGPATAPSPPPANGDEYGSSTDDMDTDDEIRMAQTSCKPAAVSEARRRTSASPPVSGTERRHVPVAAAGSPLPSTSAGAVRRQRRSPSPATAAAVPAKRRRSPTKPAAVAEDSDAAYEADTDEDEPAERRPDTTGLRVPELPDFLRGKTFLLYGQTMSTETRRRAGRYITAFGGKLEQYFGDGINYVITSDVWDGNFDEALSANPELMFARPTWLDACARQQKLVPPQAYLVTADL